MQSTEINEFSVLGQFANLLSSVRPRDWSVFEMWVKKLSEKI
jgi:hypothetical protein